MRISIVLCTYNGSRYLEAQLGSLLAQTQLPDELVIRDDSSTDATWTMLERFAAQAMSRGVVVDLARHPANLGYVRNFEAALEAATGDIVFLCDQDDVWRQDKLAVMSAEFVRRHDLVLLHTDARLVDAEGQSIGLGLLESLDVTEQDMADEHAGQGFDLLLRRNLVTGATLAIRGAVLKGILPIPGGWVHDEWLAISAAAQGRIDCLEEMLVDYRQHGGNQIGAWRRSLLERLALGWFTRRKSLERLRLLFTGFVDRVDEGRLPVDDRVRQAVRQRLDHAMVRCHLPLHPFRRLRSVWTEWQTGRYQRYSYGARSALGDLLGLRI